MNLGKLRRRLIVTGRDEPAAVVRTRGDDAGFDASPRTPARQVADDELPPLRVIDRPDETGSAHQG
ncbi:MAG: hypothetical protein R6V28_01865 [Nitriliruptoraceae bacterium]